MDKNLFSWIMSLLSLCRGYHVYQPGLIPAEALPQTWISLTNDTYDAIRCSTLCSKTFDEERGCNGFLNPNTSTCLLQVLNPSLLLNDYQGGYTTGYQRSIQNLETGTVGVAIGGYSSVFFDTLEPFTANGRCNYSFTNLPIGDFFPMVGILLNRIVYYSRVGKFYQYSFDIGSWDPLPSSVYNHDRRPAKVYNNKFYVADYANAEVYDPIAMTWSLWSNQPVDNGVNSCSAIYKDTMIVAGGWILQSSMMQYNFTLGVWNILPNLESPMSGPACGFVAGKPDIFLITCQTNGYIVNLITNIRENLTPPSLTRWSATFMNLGKRTFIFGGQTNSGDTATFEEYFYSNNSWSSSSLSLQTAKRMHSVLHLPRLLLGC